MDLLKKSLLKRGTMIPLSSDKVEGLPLYILQRLQNQAKPFDPKAEFRFVGGCVRDIFLERKPKDIDIVTNTTARTLEQMGLENVGKAFPVYLYQDSEFGQMEVAVARSEEKTGMGHKGFETVPTGNFQDDQVRRDLTINAMMVDAEGNLYGPDGAIEHIKSKTLENTSDKFSEDPLRVFRAARFLAQFGQGWRISLPLIEQMSKVQPELQTLPMDRVREEFRKAMNGKEPMNFFHALQAADCLEPWFGEVSENWDAVEQMCVKPGWDAEQRMVGIGSVLQVPGSLFNRLGLSEGLKRAAEWVKTNRQRVEKGSTLSPDETVKLVQSGNRGVIEFKKLLECTLAAPKDQEYFIAAASKIKSADMTGVRGEG